MGVFLIFLQPEPEDSLRKDKTILLSDPSSFKQRLLQWAQNKKVVMLLDSNGHKDKYGRYDMLLACGVASELTASINNNIEALSEYHRSVQDWIFGYLSYDLKNEIEELESSNWDGVNFPQLYFFQPKKLFLIKDKQLKLSYLEDYASEMEQDLNSIHEIDLSAKALEKGCDKIRIRLRMQKDQYINQVNKMLDLIHRGDIYEANYCQEFFSENASIDPLFTYKSLNKISEPPFAAYLKLGDHYALCASPERFLQRSKHSLISQPIKGTARRSQDAKLDKRLKSELELDPKELSENIMIVDLVRNDLSKTAIKGSVVVEELCKVYSYKQVHQMLSTITSKIKPQTTLDQLLQSTFPMGSMTGAPKISAMKIIEKLEFSKRGLYSGSIGYINPKGDFDFNVVIRTILYNAKQKYVSYTVGSAITTKSNAVKEYEECLIKAKAMRQALEGLDN